MRIFIIKVIFFIFLISSGLKLFSQTVDSTALVLIDIQEFYFSGGKTPLVEPEKAETIANHLLTFFRKNNGTVIHIRHDFEPGGSIRKNVYPVDGEKVISKKEVNAFKNTDLSQFLKLKGIKNLILCGMQTHMCLEAATRAGSDLGYKCTVIGDACATRDLKYNDLTIKALDVHLSTLATLKSYAKVISLNDFLSDKSHKDGTTK